MARRVLVNGLMDKVIFTSRVVNKGGPVGRIIDTEIDIRLLNELVDWGR